MLARSEIAGRHWKRAASRALPHHAGGVHIPSLLCLRPPFAEPLQVAASCQHLMTKCAQPQAHHPHVQALHEAEMYYQQLQQDHRAKQDELNGQNNHARSIDRDIRELRRTQGESLSSLNGSISPPEAVGSVRAAKKLVNRREVQNSSCCF